MANENAAIFLGLADLHIDPTVSEWEICIVCKLTLLSGSGLEIDPTSLSPRYSETANNDCHPVWSFQCPALLFFANSSLRTKNLGMRLILEIMTRRDQLRASLDLCVKQRRRDVIRP